MNNNTAHLKALQAPSRKIKAKITHNNLTYTESDCLKSLSIERVGLNKFFGFGVCQTAEIVLIDANREMVVEKGDLFQISFDATNTGTYLNQFANFYAVDIKRDENTNEITIKAQDKILIDATKKTVADLSLEFPVTIGDYVKTICQLLELENFTPYSEFDLVVEETPNYEDTITLRDVLDDIAEITQTIYYIYQNRLVFYRLTNSTVDLKIGKTDYFTLTSKDAVILGDICSATELGDNITAESGFDGATQYIRDNGFLDLRDDRATILENAVSAISGLSINPISCEWRGNYLLHIGDCLEITTKDNESVFCFLLDEKIVYNGGFSSAIKWEFAGDTETASNPSTIGEALNQTFARVDKVNKQVDIVVDDVASLQLTTGGISAEVAELDAAVNATMTSEEIKLAIKNGIMENGVDKVITQTGFKFDDVGLTISKSGTEMETTITEDGMSVSKNNSEVLTADNTGVVAVNLYAKTYLIVGENSRFENYGNNRTGCFWIGGN